MKNFERRNKNVLKNLQFILLIAAMLWVYGAGTAWPFGSVWPVKVHKEITHRALEPNYNHNTSGFFEILSSGQVVFFSENALKEIVKANRASDSFFKPSNPIRHFDDEKLIPASRFLMRRKQFIIGFLTRTIPNGRLARKYLGQALHALQDYYSHTNWVELGKVTINDVLGRSEHVAPPEGSTCPDFPAKLGDAGLTSITSGFYIEPLCDPRIKVESGAVKCIHGDIIPPRTCDGLNKDIPGRPRHFEAKDLAVEATIDYVQQVIDDIRADSSIQNKDEVIRILLDQPAAGIQITMSGFNAVGNAIPPSETENPFGPVFISNTLSPSTGILIAVGDTADGGIPGDINYVGDLIFSSSAGSPIFVTSQRLGSMTYDSNLQAWKINFPSNTDFSGITSLRVAVHLTFIERSAYMGEATAGSPAADCDTRRNMIFDILPPISNIQLVVNFTNLFRVVVPPADNPCSF
jgi:hypothetical protein